MIDRIHLIKQPIAINLLFQTVKLGAKRNSIDDSICRQSFDQRETLVVAGWQLTCFVAVAEVAVSKRIGVYSQPCTAVKSETAVIHIDVGERAWLSRSEQMRRHSTHRRIAWLAITAIRAQSTGQHPVSRCPVIAIAVRKAADHRAFVHDLRVLRQQFADLKPGQSGGNRCERPAIFGGSTGFHVERVKLRRSAVHPDENDGFLRSRRCMGQGTLLRAVTIPADSDRTSPRADLQHSTTRNAITKLILPSEAG